MIFTLVVTVANLKQVNNPAENKLEFFWFMDGQGVNSNTSSDFKVTPRFESFEYRPPKESNDDSRENKVTKPKDLVFWKRPTAATEKTYLK